jgi:hypothetical protein
MSFFNLYGPGSIVFPQLLLKELIPDLFTGIVESHTYPFAKHAASDIKEKNKEVSRH